MDRTRIVRWLRVLLPLAALAILSTLFLLGRKPGETPNIPYARVDAEDMARDPRMIAPEYAAVTPDGARISVNAAEATPDPAAGGGVSSLRLSWQAADGLTADLTAPDAAFGEAEGGVSLTGGVRMTTSSGWVVTAPRIDAAGDRSRLTAGEGVAAEAPFGQLTAGAMELRRADPATGGAPPDSHVLNFTGGVRLIYQP